MNSIAENSLKDCFCGVFQFDSSKEEFHFDSSIGSFLPLNCEKDLSLEVFLRHVIDNDQELVRNFFQRKIPEKKVNFTIQNASAEAKDRVLCSIFCCLDQIEKDFLHGIAINITGFLPGNLLFKDLKLFVDGIGEIRRVTHDLNNQFQIIAGFGSAIEDEVQDPDMKDCAKNVMNAVGKAIDNNKHLRKFFPAKNSPNIFLPKGFSEEPSQEPAVPSTQTTTSQSSAEKPTQASDPMKILVVDDEPLVQKFLCEMLKRLKYTPYGYASGTKALEATRSGEIKFDLAILDMNLPDIETEELFEGLLEIDPLAKIILISGDNLSETSQRILDKGARDYLQKPTTVKKLSETISEVLAS